MKTHNYAKKIGLPPESLVYTGSRDASPGKMEWLVYDGNSCQSSTITTTQELSSSIDKDKINLIILNNLTDVTLIENVGKFFSINYLVLEDALNISHLPKVEESGEQLVLTMKLLEFPVNGQLVQHHVTLVLGDYYVIVLKDFENAVFNDVITRIIGNKSRARQKKADYLFYLLADTLVDTYYGVVSDMNTGIDKLEQKMLSKPEHDYVGEIYRIRQPMGDLRAVLYPVREALLNVVQGDYAILGEDTVVYLHDVKDHINHIIHMFELSRDTLANLVELNSANISNQQNRSVKILTIITTLFIPLTLIAGIYGMNFKFMPELEWKPGYPFSILLMAITAGIMYFIIRKNRLL